MMKYLTNIAYLALLTIFCLFSKSLFAQENNQNSESSKVNSSDLVKEIENELSNIFIKKDEISSLMFSESDSEAINRAVESLRSGVIYIPEFIIPDVIVEEKKPIHQESTVYLASIMYIDKNNWTVWINDKKITSDNNRKGNELFLSSVTKYEISVTWTLSHTKWQILRGNTRIDNMRENEKEQIEIWFKLKPHQTYLLIGNVVAEGLIIEDKSHLIKNSQEIEAELESLDIDQFSFHKISTHKIS